MAVHHLLLPFGLLLGLGLLLCSNQFPHLLISGLLLDRVCSHKHTVGPSQAVSSTDSISSTKLRSSLRRQPLKEKCNVRRGELVWTYHFHNKTFIDTRASGKHAHLIAHIIE